MSTLLNNYKWSRRHTDISHDTSTYIDKREYSRALGNFGPFWYDNGKASQLQITASMRLLYNLLRIFIVCSKVDCCTHNERCIRGMVKIAFDEVTKEYPGASKAAVDGVTFGVQEGVICMLLGTPGSGKHPLLRILYRLIQPTSQPLLIIR